MNAAERLPALVVLCEVWSTLLLSLPLALSVPPLLLIDPSLRTETSNSLLVTVVLAAILAAIHAWAVMRQHRGVLRALATGSGSLSDKTLRELGRAPAHLARAWIVWHLLSLVAFVTPLRPTRMDLTTGIGVTLLSGLMVATASLPLNGVLRNAFLRALELAPKTAARAMLLQATDQRSRITRRLALALATPTFLVALGSALIIHAHLRQADEHGREITALALARSSLEDTPGILQGAGLKQALDSAQQLGFSARLETEQRQYRVTLGERGVLELTTPLDRGSALVRFSGSTLGVVGLFPVLLSLLAVIIAALLGNLLGAAFTNDLLRAVDRVGKLTTDGKHKATVTSRFSIIEELGLAIQQLAQRFMVFAHAQEIAIASRASAARARGLFFASVSHDLKNPLNAILGFTELVRQEPLSEGQAESLHVIQTRGKELLALIETILDAARAEAGQLNLMYEHVPFSILYQDVLERIGPIAGDYQLQLWDEIEARIPPLLCDRVRLSRALATFIAYSVRATQGGKLRLRAEMEDASRVRIDVDAPGHLHRPKDLELMMTLNQSPGKTSHRLSVGLRLAYTVIDLHHGEVRVIDRGPKGAMFCITLGTLGRSSRRRRTETAS